VNLFIHIELNHSEPEVQNNFIMLVYCSYCVYNLSASVKLITLPCYLLHPVRQLVRHRLSVVMYSVMNVFVCEVDVL